MSLDVTLDFPEGASVGWLWRYDTAGASHSVGPLQGRILLDRHNRFGATVSPRWVHALAPLAPDQLLFLDLHQFQDLTDDHLAEVAPFTGLLDLNLSKCRAVTDRGVRHLANAWALEDLDLYQTQITDEALATIGRLYALKRLHLGGTRILGPGLACLDQLARLERLSVETTEVDDVSILAIADLPSLATLVVREAHVTAEGAAELRRQRPSLQIHGVREKRAPNEEYDRLARTLLVAFVHRLAPGDPVTPSSTSGEVADALNRAVPRFSVVEVPEGKDQINEIAVPHMDAGLANARALSITLLMAPKGATLRVRTAARPSRDVAWLVRRGDERRGDERRQAPRMGAAKRVSAALLSSGPPQE